MSVPGSIKTSSDIRLGIDQSHAATGSAQRRTLAFIAEGERCGIWKSDGCRDMAQWVSGRLGISPWMAARWVKAAFALEKLPGTAEALASGVLSIDKVVELTRFATPDDEAGLVRWAKGVHPATIRRRADRANAPSLQDQRDAHNARYLEFWRDDLMLRFEGALSQEEGARFKKALDRLADSMPKAPDAAMTSTIEARRADALAALAAARLAEDSDQDRATVVVHVDLDSLSTGAGGAELEGGGVLNAAIASRLACCGNTEWVLSDGDRHAVGLGRRSRRASAQMERHLRYRDGGCTFPGCGAKRFTQAHHIDPWPEPTNLDNLTLVCGFHHKLVHEFAWRVALTDTGRAEWFRPDGSRYEPGVKARPPP